MPINLKDAIEIQQYNDAVDFSSNPLASLFQGISEGITDKRNEKSALQKILFENSLKLENEMRLQELKNNQERLLKEQERQNDIKLKLAEAGIDPNRNKMGVGVLQKIENLNNENKNILKKGTVIPTNADEIKSKLYGTDDDNLTLLAEHFSSEQTKPVITTDPITGEVVGIHNVDKDAIVFKGEQTPASMMKFKFNAMKETLSEIRGHNRRVDEVRKVREAAERVSGGIVGKTQRDIASLLNPKSPILADFQLIKSLLTDITLLNTAKTKGAISDQEMDLFKEAAANDDLFSIQKIKPVLDKLLRFSEDERNNAMDSFNSVFKDEDSDATSLINKTAEESNKSPYPEYPDAFLENGNWKVIVDGKKYIITE